MNNENSTLNASTIYNPHPNQLLIHEALEIFRNVTVDAGRRFGKSAVAINTGIAWIMNPQLKDQMVWLIMPTYKQARDTYWIDPDMVKFYMPYVQTGFLKKNDSILSLHNEQTGSWLILKGSNEADSLRGSGLDLIIWDEVSDVKPNAFDIISPTLADSPHHRVLYIGTPEGYNHFHDFCLRGDRKGVIERAGKSISLDPDWQTFKFTSYDNLSWAEGSIERISFVNFLNKERQHYIEIGQEDWFEQEYLGE